jgi:hypothetical protein
MIPQRLLDLFEQPPSKPSSESSSSASSRSDAAETNTSATHTIHKSTRIVPFDNTAFLPPTPCTSSSAISPFPSTVCPSSASTLSLPPRSPDDTHLAEFVVAYLATKSGDQGKLDDLVAGIVTTLGIVARGGPEEENVRERVAMFLGWMKPLQRVVFVAQNKIEAATDSVTSGVSSANGISSDLRWVGQPTGGKKEIVWRALTAPGDDRRFEMRTYFTGPRGWTVISDVSQFSSSVRPKENSPIVRSMIRSKCRK